MIMRDYERKCQKDKVCFAVRIVNLYKFSDRNQERVWAKTVVVLNFNWGINTGSEHAESKADFIHKLSIVLKENETDYWIELLFKTNFLSENEYTQKEMFELIKLLYQ